MSILSRLQQKLASSKAARMRALANQHKGETITTSTRCPCGEVHTNTHTWSPQVLGGGTAEMFCDTCRRPYRAKITIGDDPPDRAESRVPWPHTARWNACSPEARAHLKNEAVTTPGGLFVRWSYHWHGEGIYYCPWCGDELR